MKGNIRFSACLANYNHGHYLEKRLASILEQLGENDEIVFVDDASTDNSIEIVTKIANSDSRIRIFRNSQNLGVIKNTNASVNLARGQYIATMASDDVLLPGFISKTLSVLLKNPEIGICFSNSATRYVGFPDKNPDKIVNPPAIEGVKEPTAFPPASLIKLFRTTNFWISGHTAILKRELFFKYGGLDATAGQYCDWILLHEIALNEGAAYIPEALSVWIQHPLCYSKQANEKENRDLCRRYFKKLSQKDQRSRRKLFSKAGFLIPIIKDRFFWFLLRPQYWDFLFYVTLRYCQIRLRRRRLIKAYF